MGASTHIPWCDSTWNPIRGCEKTSPGCKNCYITTTAPFRILGQKHGDPAVYASEHTWNDPFRWNKKPCICDECGFAHVQMMDVCKCGSVEFHRRRVFSPSLSDWLWDKIEVGKLARFLDTIRQCADIDFLLLTKRPELFDSRMLEIWHCDTNIGQAAREFAQGWRRGLDIPKNVWIGTSVEDQQTADKRIPALLQIPTKVRFLSVEPLLGLVDLNIARTKFSSPLKHNLDGTKNVINWAIVGGESGPNARPCNIDWIRSIKDQCQSAGVPVFVKQLGAKPITDNANCDDWPDDTELVGYGDGFAAAMAMLQHPKGGDPDEWPEDLRVRQFPK